jgi:hypothetical protein
MLNNIASICSSLQGGLIGFPNMNNMRHWNPFQQMQAMYALQTLMSLGACNLGQLGVSPNNTTNWADFYG